jgi:hypothetical protein
MKPLKIIRRSDGEELTLNEDGETYSFETMKKQFPDHIHLKYPLNALENPADFIIIPNVIELKYYLHGDSEEEKIQECLEYQENFKHLNKKLKQRICRKIYNECYEHELIFEVNLVTGEVQLKK